MHASTHTHTQQLARSVAPFGAEQKAKQAAACLLTTKCCSDKVDVVPYRHTSALFFALTSRMTANAAPGPGPISGGGGSDSKGNILIMGLRRSGKSSIVEVVYKSLPPDDSLFLESTLKCQPLDVDTFQPVRIWDGTGNTDGHDDKANGRGRAAWGTGGQLYWVECSAVIFVIDSQDDLYDAIDRLNDVILDAYAYNPLIHFHVFVHKVDGHSTDYRYDTLHNIQSRVADNLADASASFIFAPTAQEILAEAAAERERQETLDGDFGTSLAPAGGYGTLSASSDRGGGASGTALGTSMSNFASTGGLPSGIGPDLERDVQLSFHTTSIYNPSVFVAFSRVQIGLMNADVSRTLEALCNGLSNSCKFEKVYLFDVPTKTFISADSSPFDENNFEAVSEYLNFLVQFSGLYRNLGDQADSSANAQEARYSASIARLSPDTTLGFHQINYHLALAFTVRTDIHTKHAGMIDFNIAVARKAIIDVYEACHA